MSALAPQNVCPQVNLHIRRSGEIMDSYWFIILMSLVKPIEKLSSFTRIDPPASTGMHFVISNLILLTKLAFQVQIIC